MTPSNCAVPTPEAGQDKQDVSMTEIDTIVARIEAALAAGPSEGPWFTADWDNNFGENLVVIERRIPEVLTPGRSSIWPDSIQSIKVADTEEGDAPLVDAAYIAACSPDAIRALLADRDLAVQEAVAKERMPENMTQAMLDAMRIGHRGDYPSDELCRVRYAALQAAIRKDQTP